MFVESEDVKQIVHAMSRDIADHDVDSSSISLFKLEVEENQFDR